MNLFDILFLLMLAITGSGGQEIQFQVPQHSSSCHLGFRGDIDKYNITGTIGPNYTALVESGWGTLFKLQVLPFKATNYENFCYVSVGKGAVDCNPSMNDPCYCYKFDATTGMAHFIITAASKVSQSQGTLRMEWQHRNNSVFHGFGDKTLPGIYDVYAADLTLSVNGKRADVTPESCGTPFNAGTENNIMLCCSKAALPCYPRIAFNGTIVAVNQSSCVNYTFTANETVNVTKSYSVCSLTDYKPGGSCVMIETKRLEVTTVATTYSSTETGFDSSTIATTNSSTEPGLDSTTVSTITSSTETESKSDENLDLKLGLGITLPVVAVAAAAVGIFLVKHKKSKSDLSGRTQPSDDTTINPNPDKNKRLSERSSTESQSNIALVEKQNTGGYENLTAGVNGRHDDQTNYQGQQNEDGTAKDLEQGKFSTPKTGFRPLPPLRDNKSLPPLQMKGESGDRE